MDLWVTDIISFINLKKTVLPFGPADRIALPWLGIKSVPPALEAWSLHHFSQWSPRHHFWQKLYPKISRAVWWHVPPRLCAVYWGLLFQISYANNLEELPTPSCEWAVNFVNTESVAFIWQVRLRQRTPTKAEAFHFGFQHLGSVVSY